MSTHIVACLLLYRHRQVRVALRILPKLFMRLLYFFFTFFKLLCCYFVLSYFNFI